MRTRVFVIEDHAIVLSGIAALLANQADFEFCGSADSAANAVESARAARAELILLDLRLGEDDGTRLIAPLLAALPHAPVLVLSMNDEMIYAERMIALGAKGFIGKEQAARDVLNAMRLVMGGGVYLSPAVHERILGRAVHGRSVDVAVPEQVLSAREMQVFRLLGTGSDLAAIAASLDIGLKTADSHRRNIREKLGLASSAELLRYAVHWARAQPCA